MFDQAENLVRELEKIPGLEVGYAPYEKHRRIHRVVVPWDEQKLGLTADECERQLLDGDPRIVALRNQPPGIKFAMFLGEPGDERIVARRRREIFSRRVAAHRLRQERSVSPERQVLSLL